MAWPPGITVRSATRADLAAVVALLRGAEQVDVGEATIERSDVEAHWNTPGFDLAADVRLLHAGADLVAYAQVFAERAQGAVSPEARGRGLGTALLAWVEQRAREQAVGRAEARVGQTLADTARASIELFQRNGYSPLFTAWGLRLPPATGLSAFVPPPEITIRALRAGEERAVYEVVERAFNEWPDRSPQSFEAWRALNVDRSDFDPGLTFVALAADDRIVGIVYGIHYPDGGWAQQLAVESEHRRRGIARALLAALFGEFRRRGEPRIGLSTDSRTGALGLYTRLGMEVERSFTRWSKLLVVAPPAGHAGGPPA